MNLIVGAVGMEFVSGPIGRYVTELRATPGESIWMMGGGSVIGSFLDERYSDEFVIHVIPTFIGEGIPLVAPRHRAIPLALRSWRCYADGVVCLHYLVRPGRGVKRGRDFPVGSSARQRKP